MPTLTTAKEYLKTYVKNNPELELNPIGDGTGYMSDTIKVTITKYNNSLYFNVDDTADNPIYVLPIPKGSDSYESFLSIARLALEAQITPTPTYLVSPYYDNFQGDDKLDEDEIDIIIGIGTGTEQDNKDVLKEIALTQVSQISSIKSELEQLQLKQTELQNYLSFLHSNLVTILRYSHSIFDIDTIKTVKNDGSKFISITLKDGRTRANIAEENITY